jgi:hypothetical protein
MLRKILQTQVVQYTIQKFTELHNCHSKYSIHKSFVQNSISHKVKSKKKVKLSP